MAKRLHLICNAHLDPVWQWEWEEGAAETLSTFRIAADFCEEYDNFVFCHNEALLYKWIEEYDMPLFEHIRELVKKGKWRIMGGWHVQPDCNMPSGEAFVRQIFEGRKYFLEKFGVIPTVAVNLDPFGHSRGLVQIMKKSGYDGYLFMRPDANFLKLPANDFTWVGYDGSKVTGMRIHGGYNSGKGRAALKIKNYIDACPEDDFFLCLWGIGNHGGGPSKKDLDDIEVLTAEEAKEGVTLIQSDPETYLADAVTRDLPRFEKSLWPWAPGCYTSMARVKQTYRKAENTFTLAEIMATHASSAGLMTYPEKEFAEALYDILTVQFHDMLPGSSIQPAEEMILRMLDHAIEILSRVKARAFFALAAGQPKASPDKIPVFAYNPYPYPVEGDYTAEFMLWDQDWDPGFRMPVVYDVSGKALPTQCEKEHSTIPLQWRKRVVFHATLAPMSLNRFDCGFISLDEKPVPTLPATDSHYIFEAAGAHVEINRATGLVDVFRKDGKDYLAPGAFAVTVWEDNYDPWYMEKAAWTAKIGAFTLLSPEETQKVCHTDSPLDGVHLIEGGDVRTVAEACFGCEDARAVVKYLLSASGEVSVTVRIVSSLKQKFFKLAVPAAFAAGECLGEEAYGREVLFAGLKENVAQKYVALCDGESAILAVNNGSYGSSFDETAHTLYLSLMRSPSYTAHPLSNRVTMPQDRYMPYIDQGERDFAFGFTFGAREDVLARAGRLGEYFNVPPMVLSFYPTGVGTLPASPCTLSGSVIELTALKKADAGDGVIARLFNPTSEAQTAAFTFEKAAVDLTFGPYEIKTVRVTGGKAVETDLLEGLLDT